VGPAPVIGAGDGGERVGGQVWGRALAPGEQVESGMMTQRARPFGSDPAGAGTAMIASGALPAPLPAHIGVRKPARSPPARTLPKPWRSLYHGRWMTTHVHTS
jgi:hypothetical protein